MNKPFNEARWWGCGDICNCSYPYIIRLTPPLTKHEKNGVVWESYAEWKELGEGPWGNDADNLEEQWKWMLEMARRFEVVNLKEIEEEAKEYIKDEN